MGQIIEVLWKKGNVPPQEVVQQILIDYLGGALERIETQEEGDLLVNLRGASSHPMRSIYPQLQVVLRENRYFEVDWRTYSSRNGSYQRGITLGYRDQDEYTVTVLEGFAKVLEIYYKARVVHEE